jgi:hypothetical protein
MLLGVLDSLSGLSRTRCSQFLPTTRQGSCEQSRNTRDACRFPFLYSFAILVRQAYSVMDKQSCGLNEKFIVYGANFGPL